MARPLGTVLYWLEILTLFTGELLRLAFAGSDHLFRAFDADPESVAHGVSASRWLGLCAWSLAGLSGLALLTH